MTKSLKIIFSRPLRMCVSANFPEIEDKSGFQRCTSSGRRQFAESLYWI